MQKIEIEIYSSKTGKTPYAKWMASLGDRIHDKVARRIANLKVGNFGDAKPIKGIKGIYEMRIHDGPGYRIYYGMMRNILVVLLCGGDKGTQKRDIEKAKKYWQDYLENMRE
jgi:putative addiction module killer protein